MELGGGWSIRILLPGMTSDLGSAYALSGRVDEAMPLLEQAVEQHTAIRGAAGLSAIVTNLGRAHLLAGRLDNAAALGEQSLALSRAHRERGQLAHANYLRGEIAAHAGAPDLEKAEAAYREGIALSEELEMRPLAAQCRLGLGTLYRRASLPEKAMEQLSAASLLFGKMDMPFWLLKSEAEIKTIG